MRSASQTRVRVAFTLFIFCLWSIAIESKTILFDESDNATNIVLNVGLSVKLKSNTAGALRLLRLVSSNSTPNWNKSRTVV